MNDFLEIRRGTAPLVIGLPHTGTDLPAGLAHAFASPWLARHDTDWWLDALYGFAGALGATIVRTRISRSVIDCNRDPSGASLYPGQATTGLCPVETFDGAPLYRSGVPDAAEIARRSTTWFEPYHAALATEIAMLRTHHPSVVLYDAHSIRSRIPRLFEGELPVFNIGTNNGTSCDPGLTAALASICAASGHSHVVDGRFRGGWTTRHHGQPGRGVHAVQMELAMRSYMDEPARPDAESWPTTPHAAPVAGPVLERVLAACILFAKAHA